ncbi:MULTISPECIES: hypothetical protein [Marinococcus]|uniref:Uncharacterized protein n=1 Tax=Marinococcus luteus TaxID=1122204 RepID=A0A1H2SBF4_9BACI|nr:MULTISPECIES: hypothetical protein [Marinococcus]SDW28991.1 hypothetical protein SAMN05421781_1103 [Marinococcus luteus]
MELFQCTKSVYKHVEMDVIEIYPPQLLFRHGYIYPGFFDDSGVWMATDEEDVMHVISEHPSPEQDHWFQQHFKKV